MVMAVLSASALDVVDPGRGLKSLGNRRHDALVEVTGVRVLAAAMDQVLPFMRAKAIVADALDHRTRGSVEHHPSLFSMIEVIRDVDRADRAMNVFDPVGEDGTRRDLEP